MYSPPESITFIVTKLPLFLSFRKISKRAAWTLSTTRHHVTQRQPPRCAPYPPTTPTLVTTETMPRSSLPDNTNTPAPHLPPAPCTDTKRGSVGVTSMVVVRGTSGEAGANDPPVRPVFRVSRDPAVMWDGNFTVTTVDIRGWEKRCSLCMVVHPIHSRLVCLFNLRNCLN